MHTELLGPCLGCRYEDIEDVYPEDRFSIELRELSAAHVARGVAYLHSCGIVHGGNKSVFFVVRCQRV